MTKTPEVAGDSANSQIAKVTLVMSAYYASAQSRKPLFKLVVEESIDRLDIKSHELFLPLKEAAYLWAWLAEKAAPRTNAYKLGLTKAANIAALLTGNRHVVFNNTYEAYQFFKRECDSEKLRLLLGADYPELAMRLERDPNYKVYGGYVGGDTESKDKIRFKRCLEQQLNKQHLVSFLLPQQNTNTKGKRIQNEFFFNVKNYEIIEPKNKRNKQ